MSTPVIKTPSPKIVNGGVDWKGKVWPVKVRLFSHGLKKGTPFPRAELYLDCRGVREPDGIDGEKKEAAALIRSCTDLSPYLNLIFRGIEKLPTRRGGVVNPFEAPFSVCCFCAWGLNRSPTMKMILGEELNKRGFEVEVILTQYVDPFLKAANAVKSFKSGAEAFLQTLSDEERTDLQSALDKFAWQKEQNEALSIVLLEKEINLAESGHDEAAIKSVMKRLGKPRSVVRWAVWAVPQLPDLAN